MIGKRIEEMRKRLNLTQEQLGKQIGMTAQAIQRIESGKTEMPRKLKQIADVLGVKQEWLLTGNADYLKPETDTSDMLSGLDYDQRNLLLILQGLTAEQRKDLIEQARQTAHQNEKIMEELLSTYNKTA